MDSYLFPQRWQDLLFSHVNFWQRVALQNHVWYKTHFGNVSWTCLSCFVCSLPPWDFCQQLPYILKVFTRKTHRVDWNTVGPSMERDSHTLGLHRTPIFFTCVLGAHEWVLCILVIFRLRGSSTNTYPARVFVDNQMRLCLLGACIHSVVTAAVCTKQETCRDLTGWQSLRILSLSWTYGISNFFWTLEWQSHGFMRPTWLGMGRVGV